MVSQAHSEWQEISKLTKRMLASARAGDWVGVATLEAERQHHLDGLSGVRAAEPGGEVLAEYRQLLENDRELLRLSAAARGEMERQLTEVSQGRRAVAAYGQAGKTTLGTP